MRDGRQSAKRFVDKWLDGGNSPERSIWTMAGPSRRLRKLYKLLYDIDTDIEQSRKVNYCPEHAPTACRIARRVRNELEEKRYDILRRINNIQNNGED
jgi:hypothetical protein